LINRPRRSPARRPVRSWLPNLLSASRLLLAFPVIYLIVAGRWRAAVVLLLIAGLTDSLDGLLARRWNAASRLGAYLDPLADKVLLSGSFLALGLAGALPWWLVGLVFGRDVLILAGAGAVFLWRRRRDFRPSLWGKLSTWIQVVTAAAAMVGRAWPQWGLEPAAAALVWATAVLTAWSGLDYLRRACDKGCPETPNVG
jgi:cardiolipin synthase